MCDSEGKKKKKNKIKDEAYVLYRTVQYVQCCKSRDETVDEKKEELCRLRHLRSASQVLSVHTTVCTVLYIQYTQLLAPTRPTQQNMTFRSCRFWILIFPHGSVLHPLFAYSLWGSSKSTGDRTRGQGSGPPHWRLLCVQYVDARSQSMHVLYVPYHRILE